MILKEANCTFKLPSRIRCQSNKKAQGWLLMQSQWILFLANCFCPTQSHYHQNTQSTWQLCSAFFFFSDSISGITISFDHLMFKIHVIIFHHHSLTLLNTLFKIIKNSCHYWKVKLDGLKMFIIFINAYSAWCVLSCFSCVQLFATLWTVARQASLSMGFSRQEYWSGLPFSPLGDLPDSEIKPRSLMSPALAGGFFTTSPI